jgi:uncharacterized protein YegL
MNTRRLPVYLVIDCSESMVGPAFDAVQNGIQTLINEIYSDPVALETAALSVITFSANAKVAVPLTEITQFQKPKLVLGSGTSLGLALDLVSQRLKTEVRVQTKDVKGDWKPIVFILTDGNPTDTWFKSADRFKAEITGKKANVIAVACGPDVLISNLRRITDITLAFKDPTEISCTHFFKWVSQSVQTTSHRFSENSDAGVSLPELPACMEMATEDLHIDYSQNVFIMGRCSRTKGLYIMKYERIPKEILEEVRRKGVPLPPNKELYGGVESYPIIDFDFASDGKLPALSVSSDSLVIPPACPYCSNKRWAFDLDCNNIFCIGEQGRYTCPWCGGTDDYCMTDESFEVQRRMG